MAITTLDGLVAGFDAAKTYSPWVYKYIAASEAAGVMISWAYAVGLPGACAVPSSGMAGEALTSLSGQIPFTNPSGGNSAYLGQWSVTGINCDTHMLYDRLWQQSGIGVTTTTAQTINSVAFPARDVNGTVNGEGVNIAIEVSTATTNGSAVTNTTMSYTNSAGTSGRTGTIPSFPATCVAGSFIPFTLQAGDTGVKSVESITLGTSYGAGTINLVAYRTLAVVSGRSSASQNYDFATIGLPRLFDNTVPMMTSLYSGSGASSIFARLGYAHG